MRKLLIGYGIAAVCAVMGGALVFESGCYSRDVCDGGGFVDYGQTAGEGSLVTADLWESSGQTDDWLFFPRKRQWIFHPRGLEGRGYVRVNVYVSPDQVPSKPFTQFTQGAGNITEFHVEGDAVRVINDTCEDFWVRAVIEAYPAPPDAGSLVDSATPSAGDTGDAGDAGDANASDASDAADGAG